MYGCKVILSCLEDVKNFCLLPNKYKTSIMLEDENYTVDAKSIMSIFSLNLSKPLNVKVNGECPKELIREIKNFSC